MAKFSNGTCIYVGSTPLNHLRLRYRNDGNTCTALHNGWYVESRSRQVQGTLWQQFTTERFAESHTALRFAELSFIGEGPICNEPELSGSKL